MNRNHEKLLIATLAGLVVAGAAALFIAPVSAAGYSVDTVGRVINVEDWDQLNVRKWPASYSAKTGEIEPNHTVWIERCVEVEHASDWCKVQNASVHGWVNGQYLEVITPENLNDY